MADLIAVRRLGICRSTIEVAGEETIGWNCCFLSIHNLNLVILFLLWCRRNIEFACHCGNSCLRQKLTIFTDSKVDYGADVENFVFSMALEVLVVNTMLIQVILNAHQQSSVDRY